MSRPDYSPDQPLPLWISREAGTFLRRAHEVAAKANRTTAIQVTRADIEAVIDEDRKRIRDLRRVRPASEKVDAIRTGAVLPSDVVRLGPLHVRLMALITSEQPPRTYREMGERLGISRDRASYLCHQLWKRRRDADEEELLEALEEIG